MPVTVRTHVFAAALMLCVPAAHAGQDPLEPPIVQSLGAAMEGFPYPYPVAYLPLTMEGQMVKMAYMDVPPAGKPNGRNLLLLHGRNFGGYLLGEHHPSAFERRVSRRRAGSDRFRKILQTRYRAVVSRAGTQHPVAAGPSQHRQDRGSRALDGWHARGTLCANVS